MPGNPFAMFPELAGAGLAAAGTVASAFADLGPLGKPKTDETTEERLARRARETKMLAAQEKAGYTVAGAIVLIFPWGTLSAAGAALMGLAFRVAQTLRKRGDRALTGDAKAIAGFMRRSARWNSQKRERVALRLKKQLDRLTNRANRRKGKKQSDTNLIKIKLHQMKIAALVAQEGESRLKGGQPLVAGEADTSPDVVGADPHAGDVDAGEADYGTDFAGFPITYWIAGAAVGVVAAIIIARRPAAA